MTPDEQLSHALRIKFETTPSEPTGPQLAAIKREIRALGRPATHADWRSAVYRHCPSAGTYIYRGLDNSDLNALLAQAAEVK